MSISIVIGSIRKGTCDQKCEVSQVFLTTLYLFEEIGKERVTFQNLGVPSCRYRIRYLVLVVSDWFSVSETNIWYRYILNNQHLVTLNTKLLHNIVNHCSCHFYSTVSASLFQNLYKFTEKGNLKYGNIVT